MEQDEKIEIKDAREIVLPQLDLTPYIGRQTIVDTVQAYSGSYGMYILVKTDIVAVLTEKRKEPLELRASKLFSLQQDDEGNIGWGKDTKLGVFLKKMKCEHYNDLVGKAVIIQTQLRKDKEFLSFT